MKGTDKPPSPLTSGARIPSLELVRNGERLARLIVWRAICGDFACFKLLLDRLEEPNNGIVSEPGGSLLIIEERAVARRPMPTPVAA